MSVNGTNGDDYLDFPAGVTNGNDKVYGFDGEDTMYGRGGDDWLVGGKGGDSLNGGSGNDWASYLDSSAGVYVDLTGGFGLNGDAWGDTLISIENLFGSAHDDVLVGNAQANILKGAGGEDSLLGMGGADTLFGGSGDDQLFGNNGTDKLYGDADADRFYWTTTTETGLTAATADRIMDFNAGEGDLIYLSGIDANVYAADNQAFTFIGNAAFSGTPGEVRYYHSGGNTYLQLQTGMEVDIEGVIRIDGIHTPEASWFVL
jgi:Ca2+-binding RTX toxin-like protein